MKNAYLHFSAVFTAAAALLAATPAFAQPEPLRMPGNAAISAPAPAALPSPTAPVSIGTAAMSATVSMEVIDDTRPLSRGDTINLRIVEDRDPPVNLRITDSGDIEVPYIGRVPAEGRTPRRLAYEIKALLERDYYNMATVIIGLDVEGAKFAGLIYVTGMVGAPGPMQIPANEKLTVSKAILRAGGFSTFANQRKVKLTRPVSPDGKTETQIIDVKEIIEKGRQELDVFVQPDDIILVPERLINF